LPEQAIMTARTPDSPFEIAVARVVESMGLQAVPQVGVAGYFIDIGVRHPNSGDYILGIECDGATYHSSLSARDRDRLREEVIRSRGWNLHRIWSTDWFWQQSFEIERLRAAITASLKGSNSVEG
jgi:very-short-patch-repair endonuclease